MTTSWWKCLLPRYGNWGGPGWSGGKWCPPNSTDWSVPGVDEMDELFKEHDKQYQTHGCRKCADERLLSLLMKVKISGAWAKTYQGIAYASIKCRTFVESHSDTCASKKI